MANYGDSDDVQNNGYISMKSLINAFKALKNIDNLQ
jgi:hypothetical protein